jgi:hypothetical protein
MAKFSQSLTLVRDCVARRWVFGLSVASRGKVNLFF